MLITEQGRKNAKVWFRRGQVRDQQDRLLEAECDLYQAQLLLPRDAFVRDTWRAASDRLKREGTNQPDLTNEKPGLPIAPSYDPPPPPPPPPVAPAATEPASTPAPTASPPASTPPPRIPFDLPLSQTRVTSVRLRWDPERNYCMAATGRIPRGTLIHAEYPLAFVVLPEPPPPRPKKAKTEDQAKTDAKSADVEGGETAKNEKKEAASEQASAAKAEGGENTGEGNSEGADEEDLSQLASCRFAALLRKRYGAAITWDATIPSADFEWQLFAKLAALMPTRTQLCRALADYGVMAAPVVRAEHEQAAAVAALFQRFRAQVFPGRFLTSVWVVV